jgi:hypothetical protein
MDNIFEYLIYGFIIISFISSFFKKKKPLPKEPTDQTQQQPIDPSISNEIQIPVSSQQQKTEEYDIVKEIENFFNVEQPQQTKSRVHSDKRIYEGVKNRESYKPVPEKSFHTTTKSEHTFTDPWDVKGKELEKRKKNLSPQIEKQASAYEESLIKKESAATVIIKDIRERLKNPTTLKEYIIISEIIGKPKALKR